MCLRFLKRFIKKEQALEEAIVTVALLQKVEVNLKGMIIATLIWEILIKKQV